MSDPAARPATEAIDRLFLELSQFTRATTEKEMRMTEKAAELRDTCCKMVSELAALRQQLSQANQDAGRWQGQSEMWRRAWVEILQAENAALRQQLSDQAGEISMLTAEAEMWQQRAEMAEGQLKQRDTLIPPDRYERELEKAAAILQGVLHVGQYKAIGLLEVATGVQMLADELKQQGDRLAAAERLIAKVDQVHFGDVKLDRTKVGKIHLSRFIPQYETVEHQLTNTTNLIDAYQFAVAANWLPAETAEAKGGE